MALTLELKLIEAKNESPFSKTFKFGLDRTNLDYQAGQYLTLDLPVEDERGKRRPFTISSSPTEKDFLTITTRIGPSPFKQTLNTLEIGAKTQIKAPYGNFVLPSDNSKPVVMLAGGIGITPFRSMIRFASDTKLSLPITLLYSNRTPQDIPFKAEFDQLKDLNQYFKPVYTVNETEMSEKWTGLTGFIDERMLRESIEDLKNSIFYVCGPPGMVEAMLQNLKKLNIANERVKIERFSGY